MLPTSTNYLKRDDLIGNPLKRTIEVATSPYNISRIDIFSLWDLTSTKSMYSKTKKEAIIVTVTAAVVGLEVGMKLKLSGTTDGKLDGTFEVTEIRADTNQIVLAVPKAYVQTGAAGTAEIVGTVDLTKATDHGVVIRNNDNEVLFYKYDLDGIFVYKKEDAHGIVNITIVNADSSASITGATVKFSLDGVHWADFPTALTSGSIAAGGSYTFMIGYPMQCYLRIDVTSTADYYVLAR